MAFCIDIRIILLHGLCFFCVNVLIARHIFLHYSVAVIWCHVGWFPYMCGFYGAWLKQIVAKSWFLQDMCQYTILPLIANREEV